MTMLAMITIGSTRRKSWADIVSRGISFRLFRSSVFDQ
jgi:hypothetical protein